MIDGPSRTILAVTGELLSVNAVARIWGTGLTAVLQMIRSGELASLDRGLLIEEGRYDVPLIRRSWVEAVGRGWSTTSRLLPPEPSESFHRAFQVAYDFHAALDEEDAQGVFDTCSMASRRGRSPAQLLRIWQDVGGHLHEMNAGVGTSVYSLAPLDAVAVRVIADTPALPRMVEGPTPITMIDVLPLVKEESGWRIDLPLFEQREDWSQLLTSPLSASDDVPGSSDGTAVPEDS